MRTLEQKAWDAARAAEMAAEEISAKVGWAKGAVERSKAKDKADAEAAKQGRISHDD